ncbi:MAG: hypothetical protein Q7O66_23575 [Dehalococcoidia bacterium]|nr:hypothetical protein [Dehalococcoidia bacterium]
MGQKEWGCSPETTALACPNRGWLTTGRAAERLGVTSRPSRIGFAGALSREREWAAARVVSEDSVERILGIRKALDDLNGEGHPRHEEIAGLTREASVE